MASISKYLILVRKKMTFLNFKQARTHTFPSGNEQTSSGSKFDTTLDFTEFVFWNVFNSMWWREILDPSLWKSLYHISTILLVKNSKKWGQERTGIFGIHRNFLLNAFQKTTLTKKKKEVFICHGSSRSKCFLLQLLLLQQFPGTENYQRPFVSNHNAENEGSTFCFIV